MTIERETISGIGWSGGARAVRVAVQFVTLVLLARLLTPEDFGLVAMITVLTNFAALFGEFGFTAALIQRPVLEEDHRSSVFWLNLMAGLGLTLLVWLAAPLVAGLYREPRLVPLTKLVSANFFLISFSVVQTALLSREMRFRALGVIEMGATAIAGALAILLAVTGNGVWSLAWQLLAYSAVEAAALWLSSGWRPRWLFAAPAVGALLPYSANAFGFNSINYWIRNADNLLIGRFVGSDGLGVYTRAYSTMLLPLNQVAAVLGRVMFPALSKIQRQREVVKRLYLRSLRSIALVSFPMMLGLLVVADGFVLTLFGDKWVAVIPVLRVLCLVGLVQSLGTTTGWIYQSQGRTDLMFRWGLFAGVLTLIAFGVGILWGVMGVAIAYAVRSIGLTPVNFTIPGRLIDLRFGEVVRAVRGVFLCAAAMAVLVAAAGVLLSAALPTEVRFGVQVVLGILVYSAIVHLSRLDAYQEFRASVRTHLREGRRGRDQP